MKRTLDGFILAIPVLFIKQFPYAWISNLQREHAFKDGKFYVNQPPFPWMSAAGRILILMAVAGLLAWSLRGQFGLSFWQVFLIIFGFTLLYRDTQFFGAPTTYVITDQGIGIHFVPGHIDYRLFLMFKEIGRIEKKRYQKDENWNAFVRNRNTQEGLLMSPRNPNGFTRRIEKLFIAPHDLGSFWHNYHRAIGTLFKGNNYGIYKSIFSQITLTRRPPALYLWHNAAGR